MKLDPITRKIIFFILLILAFLPWIDAPTALVMGFFFSLFIGNPFQHRSSKSVGWLLKASIVGLGFGMNFFSAVKAGQTGLVLTIATIGLVLGLGWAIGKLLKIEAKTSYLVSSGTAICGGSAIAAIAPIIKANSKQISVSLATVFVLNAVALIVFPLIGSLLELSQYQFGLWSAIAIHDTSSVVGSASKYGAEALEVATTIKLGRALWIIPLSLLTVLFNRSKETKISIPYFIAFFILTMLFSTFFPKFQEAYEILAWIAKRTLVVTLFLIGAGLTMESIRSVGPKTFVLGFVLWLCISIISLLVIMKFY